jgi:CO/xanthine dehydrogenase Mo-binding subunit
MSPPVPSAPFIGKPLPRVDGRAKVTGAAKYAAEVLPKNVPYAVAVNSSIAAGRILEIDMGDAERIPGVLAVPTHLNAPRLRRPPLRPAGQSLPVIQTSLTPRAALSGDCLALPKNLTFERNRYVFPKLAGCNKMGRGCCALEHVAHKRISGSTRAAVEAVAGESWL